MWEVRGLGKNKLTNRMRNIKLAYNQYSDHMKISPLIFVINQFVTFSVFIISRRLFFFVWHHIHFLKTNFPSLGFCYRNNSL